MPVRPGPGPWAMLMPMRPCGLSTRVRASGTYASVHGPCAAEGRSSTPHAGAHMLPPCGQGPPRPQRPRTHTCPRIPQAHMARPARKSDCQPRNTRHCTAPALVHGAAKPEHGYCNKTANKWPWGLTSLGQQFGHKVRLEAASFLECGKEICHRAVRIGGNSRELGHLCSSLSLKESGAIGVDNKECH